MSTSNESPLPVASPGKIVVSVVLCTYTYGNAGSYNVLYDGYPELRIDMSRPQTPIVFELDKAVAPNIYFVGISRLIAGVRTTLPCTMSLDARTLTWVDDVSLASPDFNITLHWIAGTPIWHDPQVHNKPK
jgi:hypothetical protein